MKNVMPMQPYLVLDTDDYEVKKEMKSGISHFYEFSKKKNSKVEMKAGAGWQCGPVVWNRRAGC